MIVWFEPQPEAHALPARMPSPFAVGAPHPLARRAAEELQAWLAAAGLGLDAPGGGKMVGVLVVADPGGRVGYLRAFSGMLGGRWDVDGFAPPVFDAMARDQFWPAGEAELAAIDARRGELLEGAEAVAARAALAAIDARHAAADAELRGRHAMTKGHRHDVRARIAASTPHRPTAEGVGAAPGPDTIRGPHRPTAEGVGAAPGPDTIRGPHRPTAEGVGAAPGPDTIRGPDRPTAEGVGDDARQVAVRALDQESRADTAERRRLDAAHAAERGPAAAVVRALDDERVALAARRAERSRGFLRAIHDTYLIEDAGGARRPLRALFAPDEPPGGAGDCVGPKLIGAAYRLGLRPIAMAELWWGAPPSTGDRRPGMYYPACRGKCGPILTAMLAGLAVEPAPVFGADPIGADEPRVVYEDRWLVVVDKPVGLLSVPGRHAQLRDSVQVRLAARYPDASGPMIVHRLDLDTSGLMLIARDADTYAALQRAFARREVDKRYVAWLDGEVAGDEGVIELPLRVDLDDRPRQIVDPVHGKRAVTRWRVLARDGARTRVALFPATGRTHQLRVHAAHPRGLGAPIVGDRLYGRPDDRLRLHAEALAFVHPHTGARVELVRPAPF